MKHTYSVAVSGQANMDYTKKGLAYECYKTYVSLSKANQTIAAGETITLSRDGKVIDRHVGHKYTAKVD